MCGYTKPVPAKLLSPLGFKGTGKGEGRGTSLEKAKKIWQRFQGEYSPASSLHPKSHGLDSAISWRAYSLLTASVQARGQGAKAEGTEQTGTLRSRWKTLEQVQTKEHKVSVFTRLTFLGEDKPCWR